MQSHPSCCRVLTRGPEVTSNEEVRIEVEVEISDAQAVISPEKMAYLKKALLTATAVTAFLQSTA
jgi:hypothetical protein